MMYFGWSPLVLSFPNPPVPVPVLCWPYRACQLQLVSLSPSCSIYFFSSQVKSRQFAFFQFYPLISRNGKVHYSAGSLFCWLSQGPVVWPRLCDLLVFQNPKEVCAFHFLGRILGFAYIIFFIWSNVNFLLNSHWITFPTQSYLVLYSFFSNLLYSLILWLIVSSLSPHNQHLLFYCVLSILVLT